MKLRPAHIYTATALILLIMLLFVQCGMHVYMLDMPVNDPIMFARDNQNSDLSKVEDGGYSGAAGICPT